MCHKTLLHYNRVWLLVLEITLFDYMRFKLVLEGVFESLDGFNGYLGDVMPCCMLWRLIIFGGTLCELTWFKLSCAVLYFCGKDLLFSPQQYAANTKDVKETETTHHRIHVNSKMCIGNTKQHRSRYLDAFSPYRIWLSQIHFYFLIKKCFGTV